jgi:GR25 family glycosyltransferase involved in LPS biosynthesis
MQRISFQATKTPQPAQGSVFTSRTGRGNPPFGCRGERGLLAFYINLDSRTDRRAFMEAQFAALGMGVERLQATTPDTIAEENIAPLTMGEIRAALSPVEAAASISHFRIWRHMLAGGHRRVLVLEDDVRLSSLMPSFLAALEAGGPDTGVLRLETRLSQVLLHKRAEPAPSGISLHLPLSYEPGTGAYVISAGYAARILASPERFSKPIDDIIFSLKSPFRKTSQLRAAVPGLALFQFEVTPDYSVPDSILASDAQASRDLRYAEAAVRGPKPSGLLKLRREFRRLRRQIDRAYEVIWLRRFAVSGVVPFAGSAVTAPRSAARPPA